MDGIDWAKVRQRIANSVIVPPVRKAKSRKPKTPEEAEAWLAKERERNKDYRERNPEKVHAHEKAWRQANPEKVRAKKKRFYDAHKNDPKWMEKHRAKNRAYKLKKRMEKTLKLAG